MCYAQHCKYVTAIESIVILCVCYTGHVWYWDVVTISTEDDQVVGIFSFCSWSVRLVQAL